MKTLTFEDMAKELGISEKELIEFAKKEGLLYENGTPTQFALDKGLLQIGPDIS